MQKERKLVARSHASLTRILLSFIWIFWETISAQWGSPRKSQSSRPSMALSQAIGCSSSSVACASGSWKIVAESPGLHNDDSVHLALFIHGQDSLTIVAMRVLDSKKKVRVLHPNFLPSTYR